LLQQELGCGEFLPLLSTKLESVPEDDPNQNEDVILRIEELAESYYYSLWNSFSNEEKLFLYDLAKDRFANLKNLKIIRTLQQKGVLIVEDSLQIMNKSFSNFILSAVKEDEEMKMEGEQSRLGTWNTVQLVLVLVLLAATSFVALSREGLLGNLNAMITVVTGVLAVVTRFGGLFSSKPNNV
jgi:hypothetical protein